MGLNTLLVLSGLLWYQAGQGFKALDKMFDEAPEGDFDSSHAEYNWDKNLIKYFIFLLKIKSRH